MIKTREEWEKFYRRLGIEVDLGEVRIPLSRPGFDRLIIVAIDDCLWLCNKCKEFFPCRYDKERWSGLRGVISDRPAVNGNGNGNGNGSENNKGAYAFWVRDQVEPDRELMSLSAENIRKRGIYNITMEGRIIFELKFFLETDRHLDGENITLCAGSRWFGGAPSAEWNGSEFEVMRLPIDYASKFHGGRRVIL